MPQDASTALAHYPLKALRRNLKATLARVENGGERVLITRRGKTVAAMVPMDDLALLTKLGSVLELGVDRVLRAYAIEEALRALCHQFFTPHPPRDDR